MNHNFEVDLGPYFQDMDDLPNMAAPEISLGTAIEQASQIFDKYYTQHSKDMYHCNQLFF